MNNKEKLMAAIESPVQGNTRQGEAAREKVKNSEVNRSTDQIPEVMRVRPGEKVEIFRNKRLEYLTRTDIWVPWTVFVPMITLSLWLGFSRKVPVEWSIALFITGFFFWTLCEYTIHRFLYHVFFKAKWIQKLQYAGHWVHHQYPRDRKRLAMPPLPAIFLSLTFFGLFYLILREQAFWFYPGFMLGYLGYITLHFFQHRISPPRFKPFQRLWYHHALHHYKYHDKAFGVSTRFWDWVFGSMPDTSNKTK